MAQAILYQALVGVSQGMYVWLTSAGLTLIFGVLGVLNFAHGAFYMLGAYVAFFALRSLGLNFWAGLLLAPLAVAIAGAVAERALVSRTYALAHGYQLLLTFGLALIFDDLVKLVWGPVYQSVPSPRFLRGAVWIAGQPFARFNLFLVGVGVLVAGALWLFLHRTTWGKFIRAAAADRDMAAALGLNVRNIYTVVFAIACWLAALGGALSAVTQPASPGMGDAIIIQAFVVAVIGGLGNLLGAFVGSVLIGVLHALGVFFVPVFEQALIFLLMAAVFIWRPTGLFARAGA
ncbi:MAG: branched-chain amino acid ABC transporter permease [Bacillota bacterium]